MTLNNSVLDSAKQLYRQARFADEIALLDSTLASTDGSLETEERARLYVESSRVKRTAGLYEQCLQGLETALELKPSTPIMVEIWNEQGQLFDALNKHPEALALLQNAVAVARNALSPEDPLTGEVLTSLSLAYLRTGEMKNCTASAREAESLLRATVGEADERYACALEHLGLALLYSGKLDEPEALHRRTLEIRTAYFGPDHPEIAFSLLNLAGTLQAGGKMSEVEGMMKRSVEIFRRHYGDENNTTAMAVNNLGGFYLEQFKFKEAATQFEVALAMKERIFGEDAPALRNVLRNLGIAYSQSGREADAKKCTRRADKLLTELATAKIDVDIMIQTASDLSAEGKRKEAAELLTEALTRCEVEHGTDSPKTAIVLKFLGIACREEDSERAKDYLTRGVRITKREFGATHPRVSEMIDELAVCFLMQGDNTTYDILRQQSEYIAEASHVPSAEEKAIAMLMARSGGSGENPQFLVGMLRHMGRDNEADAIMEEYIRSKELEGGGKSLAKELATLGVLEMGYTRNEKAVEYLQKAVNIFQELPDDSAKDQIRALTMLTTALIDLSRHDQARTAGQRNLELKEALHGTNHWSLAQPLNALKQIEEKTGNLDAAKKLEERIATLPEPDPIEQQNLSTAQTKETVDNLLQPLLSFFSPQAIEEREEEQQQEDVPQSEN